MPDQNSDKCETLIIDDSSTMLAAAKKMLEDEFIVNTAKDGAEGWEIINNNENIKIVFSDMQMPVMNGMQLLLKIRESDDPRISKLPVIMVTGQSDSPAGKKAVFDIGATDFIGKPFDAMDLLSRARSNTKRRRRASDQAGSSTQEFFITPSGFQNIGKSAVVTALETGQLFTVVNIEFVNIQDVKNSVGEKSVRQIIVALVKRLSDILREGDVATRIGEDKFAVLVYTDGSNASQTVNRLCEYMRKLVFEFNGKPLRAELAYGYSSVNFRDNNAQFKDICMQADAALKEAKEIKLGNKIFAHNDDASNDVVIKHNETDAIDLWSALTNVVDGNYTLVKDEELNELVRIMNDFLIYAKEKTGQ